MVIGIAAAYCAIGAAATAISGRRRELTPHYSRSPVHAWPQDPQA
ncbi:hypothetical protein [Actinomadura violacea]|nr:hypothetical protein [Actinomadura violacea]